MSRRAPIIAVTAALALVAGCGDSVEVTPPPFSGTAIVRFVNATSIPMDFAAAGSVAKENANLGYGARSGCTDVRTAGTSLGVTETGSARTVPGLTTAFEPATRYTIVAWGGPSGTQFLTVPNHFSPSFLHAGLNVVIVAGGAGKYDVYVTAPGGERGAASASAVASGSSSAYFDVGHGAQQVLLTQAGSPALALDAGSTIFTAGTTQTLVVAAPASAPAGLGTPPRYFWVPGC
jgi:hypothetical protein